MLAAHVLWLDSEAMRRAEDPVTWWPHMRLCAAIMMDFIPEAHTLLMVVAGVLSDKPAKKCCSLIARREERVKTPPPP